MDGIAPDEIDKHALLFIGVGRPVLMPIGIIEGMSNAIDLHSINVRISRKVSRQLIEVLHNPKMDPGLFGESARVPEVKQRYEKGERLAD